jgi:6-phosphogluconolactonase (cycloisomerase 2 family)
VSATADHFAYVGSRTTRERHARGVGISVFRVRGTSARWTPLDVTDASPNPSYLALHPRLPCLYAVHGDGSEISAFRLDHQSGRLSLLNRTTTHGKNPVHLSLDPSGRFVVVANHITAEGYVSNLAVLAIGDDGAVGDLADLVPLKGPVGPHRLEQPFAKPHQALFDPSGRFVIVPDKGRDVVAVFRLGDAGKLSPVDAPPARAREGAGPRHACFHPGGEFAYVLNELNSTVTAHRFDPATGALAPFQILSVLPDLYVGQSRAAEISVSSDGRFVYASSRGPDGIALFSVDPSNGQLRWRGWRSSEGRTPRFIGWSPRRSNLCVANEDSDTIVVLPANRADGRLGRSVQTLSVGSPTCIVFAQAEA